VDFFGGIVDRIGLPESDIAELKDLLNLKPDFTIERMIELKEIAS
jgi:hypothetical protein